MDFTRLKTIDHMRCFY